MEIFDLLWTLAFTVSGCLFAAGFDVIGPSKKDFHKSRICFRLSPWPLAIITTIWAMTTDTSILPRVIITGLFGAILLIGISESLRWVKYREDQDRITSSEDSIQPTEPDTLKIILIGHPNMGQLNLYNREKNDIYLWGSKFGVEDSVIENQPRTIPQEGYYYFLTDRLKVLAISVIGRTGERIFPFEVYLSDKMGKHYIAKFNLLVKLQKGEMSVHTQQIDVSQKEWKSNLQENNRDASQEK